MIVVPLGIASATPTAARHLPSLALWREGDVFLFDCGENAQMRMLQAGIKRSKIDSIFISHFDTDHFSGLLGLLSTLQLQRRDKELTLVGPVGIKEYVDWNINFTKLELGFTINFVEVAEDFEEQIVVDRDDFYVEARPLKHKKFCIGYRFQEKDKPGKVDAEKAASMGVTEDAHFKELKSGNDITLEDGTVITASDIVGHPRPGDSFAYVTDTEYCPNAVKLAMNTNILYHEATFSGTLADKAKETGHSTALDAARVATEAQSKLLVIGHFSARYTNPFVLLREARENFFPTWLATELRPIFTDPAHEKGIIKAKVTIQEPTENKPQRGGGGGRRPQRGGGGGYSKGGKRFRSRRDDQGGGGYNRDRGGYNRDRGGYNRDRGGYQDRDRGGYNRDRGGYQDRDRGGYNRDRGGYQDRDRGNYGNADYQRPKREEGNDGDRKPKIITPRTPFDDFNRF